MIFHHLVYVDIAQPTHTLLPWVNLNPHISVLNSKMSYSNGLTPDPCSGLLIFCEAFSFSCSIYICRKPLSGCVHFWLYLKLSPTISFSIHTYFINQNLAFITIPILSSLRMTNIVTKFFGSSVLIKRTPFFYFLWSLFSNYNSHVVFAFTVSPHREYLFDSFFAHYCSDSTSRLVAYLMDLN